LVFFGRQDDRPTARTKSRVMQIERVDYTPKKDVYHPGEVLYVSVHFRTPFVGECEIGLSKRSGNGFRRTTCRQSTNRLYEGQVYIHDDQVGACLLKAALTPVKGEPQTVATGDRIFQVRPVRP
jgi:hypothetical protein